MWKGERKIALVSQIKGDFRQMELNGGMLSCEQLLAQAPKTDKTHLKKEKVGAGRWPRRTPACARVDWLLSGRAVPVVSR